MRRTGYAGRVITRPSKAGGTGPSRGTVDDVNLRGPRHGTSPVEAATELLESHGSKVRALALRLCGNSADADDLVQDVFVEVLRKWHTFRGESAAGTWLYAIAVRVFRGKLRRSRRTERRVASLARLMPWSETTVMAIAADPADAGTIAEREEARDRVQAEIAKLPQYLRLPVVLKEVLGMSVEDAAEVLGLPKNTIKTRLHRGRLALRKAMMMRAAAVNAPAPVFERQVCLDLLKAKLEAMDRGGRAAGQVVPQAEVCARCSAVFRELDIVQDACSQLDDGTMPRALRRRIMRTIADRDAVERTSAGGPRRGRRPRSTRAE